MITATSGGGRREEGVGVGGGGGVVQPVQGFLDEERFDRVIIR